MREFKCWLKNVKNYSEFVCDNLEKRFTIEELNLLKKEFENWYNNYTPERVN